MERVNEPAGRSRLTNCADSWWAQVKVEESPDSTEHGGC